MIGYIIAAYLILNIVSLIAYWDDKQKAKKGKFRTRESTLLIFGLIGPFGALAGMKLFHHKTNKPKFKLNWLFLVLHIVLIIYLVMTFVIH